MARLAVQTAGQSGLTLTLTRDSDSSAVQLYSDVAQTITVAQPVSLAAVSHYYFTAPATASITAKLLSGATVVNQTVSQVLSNEGQLVLTPYVPPVVAPLLAIRTVSAAGSIATTETDLLADATGPINPPTMVSAAQVTGGGTFAAGSYYWVVTAVDASGHESIALTSNAVLLSMANNDRATITWTNPTGTVQNKIYRCSFSYSTPTANTPNLVTTISANTTYTDTGSATTGTAPPANNGGAFTLTLPDATATTLPVTVRAIGDTPNLVTLAAFGGQKIDTTLASVVLGKVGGADYRSVTLLPSGSGWKIVAAELPPIKHLYAGNPYGVTVPNGLALQATAVVVGPVAPGYGQKAKVVGGVQLVPGAGVTEVILTVDWCDSSGNLVDGVLVSGFIPIHSNMAFFYAQNLGVGEPLYVPLSWFYDPRPGDVQRAGYAGTYNYLRLSVISVGGTTTASAAGLDVSLGAVQSAYWPAP